MRFLDLTFLWFERLRLIINVKGHGVICFINFNLIFFTLQRSSLLMQQPWIACHWVTSQVESWSLAVGTKRSTYGRLGSRIASWWVYLIGWLRLYEDCMSAIRNYLWLSVAFVSKGIYLYLFHQSALIKKTYSGVLFKSRKEKTVIRELSWSFYLLSIITEFLKKFNGSIYQTKNHASSFP